MSALGQKRTFALQKAMSALPPITTAKADIRKRPCPLYPQKRTCAVQLGMSALGQKRTHATQQTAVGRVLLNISRSFDFGCKCADYCDVLSKHGIDWIHHSMATGRMSMRHTLCSALARAPEKIRFWIVYGALIIALGTITGTAWSGDHKTATKTATRIKHLIVVIGENR